MENDQTLTALPPGGDLAGSDPSHAQAGVKLAQRPESDITTVSPDAGPAPTTLTYFQDTRRPTLEGLGSNSRVLRWALVVMGGLLTVSLVVSVNARSDARTAKASMEARIAEAEAQKELAIARQHEVEARIAEVPAREAEVAARVKEADAKAAQAEADRKAREKEADVKNCTVNVGFVKLGC